MFSVILSDFDDKDIDVGSEAVKEKYSTVALNELGNREFELLEAGPLAVGYLSTGDRILHLNFKVKEKGVSGVQTFFSELIETKKSTLHGDK